MMVGACFKEIVQLMNKGYEFGGNDIIVKRR
jgi:hypothetical protein